MGKINSGRYLAAGDKNSKVLLRKFNKERYPETKSYSPCASDISAIPGQDWSKSEKSYSFCKTLHLFPDPTIKKGKTIRGKSFTNSE
jgi:hypothetical protein